MSNTVYVRGFEGLAAALARDIPLIRQKTIRGVHQAIVATAHQIAKNVPIAFGELRTSVHAVIETNGGGANVDAPHAAAVEFGSRPHWVPLEPLIRWVKLRGMQGLSARGSSRWGRGPGKTTGEHSYNVARQLSTMVGSDGAMSIDAPEQIAKAIQLSIAKKGTKPHWYVRQSVPAAMRILHREVSRALKVAR